WHEVIEHEPASSTVIYWHETAFDRARPVRAAETATRQDWSFTRNAEEPVKAVGRMLATIGLELLSDPLAWRQQALARTEIHRPAPLPRTYPSTFDAARFVPSQLGPTPPARAH